MMNQILINILATVVVTCIVLPLICYLGVILTQQYNNKIIDEKGQTLVKHATEVILNAVRSVFQTYFQSLKQSDTFDKEAQLDALNLANDIVLKQLTEYVKTTLLKTLVIY